jgi:predicted DNA-binding protein (MmcQ/YjbR family)
LAYGFCKEKQYKYSTAILENRFLLSVSIDENDQVQTTLTERETGEPYELYRTAASGTFVGQVREAIQEVLQDISEKCYELAVFKEAQPLMLIDYVRRRYGDELEFLWERFPDNAIWRRRDNQKWYAAILTVKKSKLGLASEETAEVIDLRLEPESITNLIDNERYFPGWHMNKRHWYTMLLDGSVPLEELCRRIDDSYRIAKK